MPFSIQDSIVDIFGTLIINLIAIAFYFLGTVVFGLAIALVILIFVGIWIRESKILQKLRKKKTIINFKKYLPPPVVKVAPSERIDQINNEFDKKVLYKSHFNALDEHEVLRLESI